RSWDVNHPHAVVALGELALYATERLDHVELGGFTDVRDRGLKQRAVGILILGVSREVGVDHPAPAGDAGPEGALDLVLLALRQRVAHRPLSTIPEARGRAVHLGEHRERSRAARQQARRRALRRWLGRLDDLPEPVPDTTRHSSYVEPPAPQSVSYVTPPFQWSSLGVRITPARVDRSPCGSWVNDGALTYWRGPAIAHPSRRPFVRMTIPRQRLSRRWRRGRGSRRSG